MEKGNLRAFQNSCFLIISSRQPATRQTNEAPVSFLTFQYQDYFSPGKNWDLISECSRQAGAISVAATPCNCRFNSWGQLCKILLLIKLLDCAVSKHTRWVFYGKSAMSVNGFEDLQTHLATNQIIFGCSSSDEEDDQARMIDVWQLRLPHWFQNVILKDVLMLWVWIFSKAHKPI